jgi:hypothetical protein
MLVSSWGVAIEDVFGHQQHRASLAAGEYEATVFARPTPCLTRVRVILTRTQLPIGWLPRGARSGKVRE